MELTTQEAMQRGIDAHRAGNLKEADYFYQFILGAHPKHPDANHNMGVLRFNTGRIDEAITFFRIALETNPQKAQFWLSFINALIKLGRLEDAKKTFNLAKNRGAQGDGFDKLAQELKSIEPPVGDITQNKDALIEPPEDQMQILIDLYSRGHLQDAAKTCEKISSNFPNSATIFNIKGAILRSLGQFDLAVEAYKKAVSIKSDYAEAYNNLGVTYKDAGNLEEAVKAFNQALHLNADYSNALYNLGNCLSQQGKLEQAINAYEQVLRIEPTYAAAYNNMGTIFKNKGMLNEALNAYEKAISIQPDYFEALVNIGNTFKLQDNLDQAIDSYTTALSLKPNNAELQNDILEILKTFKPHGNKKHPFSNVEQKIRVISQQVLKAKNDVKLSNLFIDALNILRSDHTIFKVSKSQIYRHNGDDLNCGRHLQIFADATIIPRFCFSCFKVQIEVQSLLELVKLTSIFYRPDFDNTFTAKTFVEMRPYVTGFYKGIVYCRSLDQAKQVKHVIDPILEIEFNEDVKSIVKRGCSEYPIKFPEYGKIESDIGLMMSFPEQWSDVEMRFDQKKPILPHARLRKSLPEFSIIDFLIFEKWLDYAKGIDDYSFEEICQLPIKYQDVYEIARDRYAKYKKVDNY